MNYEIVLVICIIFIVMIFGACMLCNCCFMYDEETIMQFHDQPLPPHIYVYETEIV